MSRPPVACSHRSMVWAGRVDAPEMEVWIEERSAWDSTAQSMIRSYRVGTPGRTVGRVFRMAFWYSSGLGAGSSTICAPQVSGSA